MQGAARFALSGELQAALEAAKRDGPASAVGGFQLRIVKEIFSLQATLAARLSARARGWRAHQSAPESRRLPLTSRPMRGSAVRTFHRAPGARRAPDLLRRRSTTHTHRAARPPVAHYRSSRSPPPCPSLPSELHRRSVPGRRVHHRHLAAALAELAVLHPAASAGARVGPRVLGTRRGTRPREDAPLIRSSFVELSARNHTKRGDLLPSSAPSRHTGPHHSATTLTIALNHRIDHNNRPTHQAARRVGRQLALFSPSLSRRTGPPPTTQTNANLKHKHNYNHNPTLAGREALRKAVGTLRVFSFEANWATPLSYTTLQQYSTPLFNTNYKT